MAAEAAACLIRCTRIGAPELRLHRQLAAAFARVVFLPNMDSPPHGLPSVPVTAGALSALGFGNLPSDWGWFCGDFCLYLARAAMPEVPGFLLIESDVYLGAPALRRLSDLVADRRDHAMAAQLGLRDKARYSKGLAALGGEPRAGCIFPIVHAPAALIDDMAELRRRSLSSGRGRPINDEAVLAGAAMMHGHPMLALDQEAPELLGPATFSTNPPHLLDALLRAQPPEAHHPALPLEVVLARIADPARNYGAHRLRRVLAEADEGERTALRDALDAAAGARPASS
ncbi:hypothetical protein [Paracoccus tibetensis]|uniref:Glycosyltransferase involved in LPS biosynthesis, GR25 family n=1 Tax=Paracoccus tibetensis TaxID=336292 RepID=A0A1G5JS60_9RHOB|nr:hypothetical protein [Paracoccus tibetensis]SCY90994.1 hypothetical protein SAMN05660710_03398 [Paracoccus tibetensis]